MGKITHAFLFFKVCIFWFFPSVSTSLLIKFIYWRGSKGTCMPWYVCRIRRQLSGAGTLSTMWMNPRNRSQATRLRGKCLYLTLSHLWQAEQKDHNFEANFGSTVRPCLQKNLFAEVVCIVIWTILRPVCDGSDITVCLTPLPFESMPQGP